MNFKIGDRVRICKDSTYFNYVDDLNNPKCGGVIISESGAEPLLPYNVRWDNNYTNSYEWFDLEYAEPYIFEQLDVL